MIEITATVESFQQAEKLVDLNIDYLYFGDATFGLRLPTHFNIEEMKQLVNLAHSKGKKVRIAVNAIMHPDKMLLIPDYLGFLENLSVDEIVVGDPGVIHVIRRDGYNLPYVYDAATMVTSSRQINFWGNRGAIGAVLSREIPYLELVDLSGNLDIFGEMLVYGATCIHQSKRPLVQNYFNFTKQEKNTDKTSQLFISEPKAEETHYSIYEDEHGTHIFATNDVNLMTELGELEKIGLTHWKLDGIYTQGEAYLQIVSYFVEAKELIQAGKWNETEAKRLTELVMAAHPKERTLDAGFYYFDPDDIK
ncbi:peptidase U32 family protein [Vagococcus hydrophili]|uniref:U32 family peptidase n=1 Tax=Vagococcus hydrophili TaxID=2714947 RepID=A0A6G8AST4_9ENTE|nr:peptidase U32 family protein [Vagococcus hydrophili]QIL48138.1 U32 family peptidase [Vagococcus hydrophili]